MGLSREAIQEIARMAKEPEEIKIGGRKYTTEPVYKVEEPKIKEPIVVHTLQGVVDYIESNIDALEGGEMAIHVASPKLVKLISKIRGDWREREYYLQAEFKNSGHPFGREVDKENFIVSLLSNFEKTSERDELLETISSIKAESSELTQDSGISQSVTVKAGVTLVSEKTIKNPVTLQPIRTFSEVDGQPSGDYVFRMINHSGSGIHLALHDSNGDEWEVKAIDKIKEFFKSKESLKGLAILG